MLIWLSLHQDYPGGSNVITEVLTGRRQRQEREQVLMAVWEEHDLLLLALQMAEEERKRFLEARKGKAITLPKSHQKDCSHDNTLLRPGRSISAFWPPKSMITLHRLSYCLCVIFYSIDRKLIHHDISQCEVDLCESCTVCSKSALQSCRPREYIHFQVEKRRKKSLQRCPYLIIKYLFSYNENYHWWMGNMLWFLFCHNISKTQHKIQYI